MAAGAKADFADPPWGWVVTMACELLASVLELQIIQTSMSKITEKADTATADTVKDSRDQLLEDLKRVIEDAQNLAEEAKNASGAAIHEKVVAVQKDLSKRMKAISKAGGNVLDEVEEQTDNVEELIRQHPWRSVAVAALAGLLVDRVLLK